MGKMELIRLSLGGALVGSCIAGMLGIDGSWQGAMALAGGLLAFTYLRQANRKPSTTTEFIA